MSSAFKNRHFDMGFPFSPSTLRGPAGAAHSHPLSWARVNGADIPDPCRQPSPQDEAWPTGPHGSQPARPGSQDDARQPALAPRHDGLRLLPLPAFIRGGQTPPPRARARSDHVIIWLTRGRLRLELPADCQRMAAGDLRHIPAGVAFAATPMQDAQGHVALISARLAGIASPSLPESGLSAHVGMHGPQLLATLSELSAEAIGPESATRQCLMNLLALRLGQLPTAAPDHRHSMARAAPDRPLVERFLALALPRLGDCGSVADLAGEMGTTYAALDRACIAARGRRAVELLHDLRLERAVDLLRHGKQATSRIAHELGYSSHGHFTRAFVAATGRTPEAFRAQSR